MRPIQLVLHALLLGALMLVGGCNNPVANSPPPPVTTVGTEIDDSVITARVESALLADPEIRSFQFKVDTHKGEVQLSGFADSQTQIDHATDAVQGVSGVKSVQNRVSLKGSTTTVGNRIDDTVLTARVKTALLGDAHVKSLDIAVVTRKGEVQLSGFVDNAEQMDRAVAVARGIEGVTRVANELSVKK